MMPSPILREEQSMNECELFMTVKYTIATKKEATMSDFFLLLLLLVL